MRQEIYKISLELLIVPKVRKCSKHIATKIKKKKKNPPEFGRDMNGIQDLTEKNTQWLNLEQFGQK